MYLDENIHLKNKKDDDAETFLIIVVFLSPARSHASKLIVCQCCFNFKQVSMATMLALFMVKFKENKGGTINSGMTFTLHLMKICLIIQVSMDRYMDGHSCKMYPYCWLKETFFFLFTHTNLLTLVLLCYF
jgi:hypothetical protein